MTVGLKLDVLAHAIGSNLLAKPLLLVLIVGVCSLRSHPLWLSEREIQRGSSVRVNHADNALSHVSILVGDEAEAPVGRGDVDIGELPVLGKVVLQFLLSHCRVQGQAAHKQLAREVGGAL